MKLCVYNNVSSIEDVSITTFQPCHQRSWSQAKVIHTDHVFRVWSTP